MPRLDKTLIKEVHDAALRLELTGALWRRILFDGLGDVDRTIRRPKSAAAALLTDLVWLNQQSRLHGVAGPPLAVWLQNALRQCPASPIRSVFHRARIILLGRDPDVDPSAEPWAERPWPVLRAYEDPRTYAGRGPQLRAVTEHIMRGEHAVTGIFAPPGRGRSSFVGAGLVPTLRQLGVLVGVDRTPYQPGMVQRLARGLRLPSHPPPSDSRPHALVAALPPAAVIVLKDFQVLFERDDLAAHRRVAHLLAEAMSRRGDGTMPPVQVVLSYRESAHRLVQRWLALELPAYLGQLAERYPPGLGGQPFEAFRLGTLTESGLFAAITHPLIRSMVGWRFAGDGARRLAEALVDARRANPHLHLGPILQLVLAELMEVAEDRCIVVPDRMGSLIRAVVRRHVFRWVDRVAAEMPDPAECRGRLWAGLGQLVTPDGRAAPPAPMSALGDPLTGWLLAGLCGARVGILRSVRVPRVAEPVLELSHAALGQAIRQQVDACGAQLQHQPAA